MNKNKKISPQAILALKEALSLITWKKDDLKDFLKYSMDNPAILGTINWDGTKRESVKELVERMTNRPDFYQTDLMNLILAVTDLNDFPQYKSQRNKKMLKNGEKNLKQKLQKTNLLRRNWKI